MLYDNAYDHNYELLKTYYPVWYPEVFELDALLRGYGRQLDEVREGIITVINNNFIQWADEERIARLEKYLYISYEGVRSLQERRNTVAAYFLGGGHIGEYEIKEIIAMFSDGEVEMELVGGYIYIALIIDIGAEYSWRDCLKLLYKKIPAHLGIVWTEKFLPIPFINWDKFGISFISMDIHSFLATLNNSVFRELGIHSFYHNRYSETLAVDYQWSAVNEQQLAFAEWGFYARFYNLGDAILLNGRARLDGTWLLNQQFSKGLRFHQLAMQLFTANQNTVTVAEGYTVKAANELRCILQALDTAAFIRNLQKMSCQLFEVLSSFVNKITEFLTIEYRLYMDKNNNKLDYCSFLCTAACRQDYQITLPALHISGSVRNTNALTRAVLEQDSMAYLDGSWKLDGTRRLRTEYMKEEV